MTKYDIHRSYLDDLGIMEFSVNGTTLAMLYLDGKNSELPYLLERLNPHPSMVNYWVTLLDLTHHTKGTQRYPSLKKRVSHEDRTALILGTTPTPTTTKEGN